MKVNRQQERILLLLAGVATLAGIFSVMLAKGVLGYVEAGATGLLLTTWWGISCYFQRQGSNGDSLLIPVAVLLSGIGLIMILRLKPEIYLMQLLWMFLGTVVFFLSVYYCRRIETLSQFKYICGIMGVVLLLTAILFGVDIGGHRSWVILGPVRFQPSEFAKLFIVLFLAGYLSEQRYLLSQFSRRLGPLHFPQPRFIAPLLTIWGLTMVMFVLQRDMGSALMFFAIVIIMTYMASGRSQYITWGTLLFFLGAFFCYSLYPHIQTRVDIWLDPWADPNGRAYQIVQSLFALGSGGVAGVGLAYGFPQMIPEVQTDFIFSAIGEELGFLGTGAVIILYMLLVYRAYGVSLYASTPFTMLVSAGLATIMALQVFLIIAGVTKFFPLTGITLPFVSYGGSSIVANFIFLGMLFALSEERSYDER